MAEHGLETQMDGAARVVGTWWKMGDRALSDGLREAARRVAELTRGHNLTEGQREALIAFSLCRGWRSLEQSALLSHLKNGNLSAAARQFSYWTLDTESTPGVKAHSKELARRRALEYNLFVGAGSPQVARGGERGGSSNDYKPSLSRINNNSPLAAFDRAFSPRTGAS